MATTNSSEKTIQTRIINRHDSLENWNSSTLQLKEGEIALAYIEKEEVNKDHEGNKVTTKVPTYLMKIGHEGKTFNQLPWLAAPASDVHAWAKKAALEVGDLPTAFTDRVDSLETLFKDFNYDSVNEALNSVISDFSIEGNTDNTVITKLEYDKAGKFIVSTSKVTDAFIADGTISMTKISGLRAFVDAVTGTNGLASKVDSLEAKLQNVSNVMDFLGQRTVTVTEDGTINVTPNSGESFNKGDVVVDAAGKEYVYDGSLWREIGYADANTAAIAEIQSTIGEYTDNNSIATRLTNLEQEVGSATGGEGSQTLSNRITTLETLASEKLATLTRVSGTDAAPVDALTIHEQVIIFDCGGATARDGVDF